MGEGEVAEESGRGMGRICRGGRWDCTKK